MGEPGSSGSQPHPYGSGVRTTKRRGRMPPGARHALVELSPRWTVPAQPPWSIEQLDDTFGRSAPRLLDIGFGDGSATRTRAAEHPDHDVVALDVHRPGLVRLLRDLDADGPTNVRVVERDAVALLGAVQAGAFTQIRILFPDPWPKRRHHGRRMVDRGFVSRVVDLLPVGGQFHVATDWVDYADAVRQAILAEALLRPVTDRPGAAWSSTRPPRPVTAFEQRALDAGRTVTDLVARRIDDGRSTAEPSPST